MSMPEWLNIRPVEKRDERDVQALWSSDGARFWPFAFSWSEHWERVEADNLGSAFWLVAETRVDGRVVGSVRGRHRHADAPAIVHEIAVNENDRRTGVGKALLWAVGEKITLKTNAENEVSNAFYLRNGFRLSSFSRTRKNEVLFNWTRGEPVAPVAPIHLEGLGLLGSLTALTLAQRGIPFTWHDPEFPCAWKASGGIVIPSGSPGHFRWLSAVREDFPWAERGSFWSTQKTPGGAKPAADLGELRLAKLPSVHVNVQQLVLDTRAAFSGLETLPNLPPEGVLVAAHGFNSLLTGYLWGWTQLVSVEISERLKEASPHRPSVAVLKNRLEKAYCAPVPGSELYLVGSSMITMKTPKLREMGPELDKCLALLKSLSGGLIKVGELVGLPRQGWRPVSEDKDPRAGTVASALDRRVLYPPLSHSGVSEGYDLAERAVNDILLLAQP